MKWFEELPQSCPPADAQPCQGVFYRIVAVEPPMSSDFFSQRKLQPHRVFAGQGIDECIARAVSLFKDKSDAAKRLRLPKFRNSTIARVTLQPKDGLIKKTFQNSHYSWWRSSEFNVEQAKFES